MLVNYFVEFIVSFDLVHKKIPIISRTLEQLLLSLVIIWQIYKKNITKQTIYSEYFRI